MIIHIHNVSTIIIQKQAAMVTEVLESRNRMMGKLGYFKWAGWETWMVNVHKTMPQTYYIANLEICIQQHGLEFQLLVKQSLNPLIIWSLPFIDASEVQRARVGTAHCMIQGLRVRTQDAKSHCLSKISKKCTTEPYKHVAEIEIRANALLYSSWSAPK